MNVTKIRKAHRDVIDTILRNHSEEFLGSPPQVDAVTKKLTGAKPPDMKKLSRLFSL